jgi:hypothetical protein
MADSINQYADMIDPGDRLTYEIDVQSSGYYCVNYHVSSKLVASSVSTSVDGNVVVDTTDIAVTGDWNNYLPTKSDSFYMSAGKHTLDVIFKEDNCRFDAMDILMQ